MYLYLSMLEKMQNRRPRSCKREDMLMEKLHQAVTLTLPLVYIMTLLTHYAGRLKLPSEIPFMDSLSSGTGGFLHGDVFAHFSLFLPRAWLYVRFSGDKKRDGRPGTVLRQHQNVKTRQACWNLLSVVLLFSTSFNPIHLAGGWVVFVFVFVFI